jgi:hypothetical protein
MLEQELEQGLVPEREQAPARELVQERVQELVPLELAQALVPGLEQGLVQEQAQKTAHCRQRRVSYLPSSLLLLCLLRPWPQHLPFFCPPLPCPPLPCPPLLCRPQPFFCRPLPYRPLPCHLLPFFVPPLPCPPLVCLRRLCPPRRVQARRSQRGFRRRRVSPCPLPTDA